MAPFFITPTLVHLFQNGSINLTRAPPSDFVCNRVRNKLHYPIFFLGADMHLTPISDCDITLDLPLEFIEGSFRQYGVSSELLNRLVKQYANHPYSPLAVPRIKKVYWDALEHMLLQPNCTLAALLCTPFLVRNNPAFDPSKTPMWPVLTAMFNGCLPKRALNTEMVVFVRFSLQDPPEKKSEDLHMKVLAALMLLPLSATLRNKLHTDVFDQWNDVQWNALFEALNDWTGDQLLADFDLLASNISHPSNIGHWVHWAAAAMENGDRGLVEAIDRNFHDQMCAHINTQSAIVLAPHMIQDQRRYKGQYYKIWRVLDGLASYNPSLWNNDDLCKKALYRSFNVLGKLYLRADNVEEFNDFKNSQECSELPNIFQSIHTDVVQRIIYEMKSSPFSNISNALEGMLLLGYDMNWVFPYCDGLDFADHPLCLAYYQSFVLNGALSVEQQLASSREKKI